MKKNYLVLIVVGVILGGIYIISTKTPMQTPVANTVPSTGQVETKKTTTTLGKVLSGGTFYHPESVLVTSAYTYVSNIGKELAPNTKDGDGIINIYQNNQLTSTITGLDAPKGMGISNNMLYVADVDTIKIYDLNNNNIFKTSIDFGKEKTVFLNDISIANNILYISATDLNSIFVVDLTTNTYKKLNTNVALKGPNGLRHEGSDLFVAERGSGNSGNGNILQINLNTTPASVSTISSYSGFLDGIAKDDKNIYISDWVDFASGSRLVTLDIATQATTHNSLGIGGFADFALSNNMMYLPSMIDNTIYSMSL